MPHQKRRERTSSFTSPMINRLILNYAMTLDRMERELLKNYSIAPEATLAGVEAPIKEYNDRITEIVRWVRMETLAITAKRGVKSALQYRTTQIESLSVTYNAPGVLASAIDALRAVDTFEQTLDVAWVLGHLGLKTDYKQRVRDAIREIKTAIRRLLLICRGSLRISTDTQPRK